MIATIENMRKCEAAGIAAVALDVETGETFSATSGDYFWSASDQPLYGVNDQPCVLVRKVPESFESIESEDVS